MGGVDKDVFKQVTMRYSATLLEQLEAFQIQKGFPTRAQTVTYLLIMALDAHKKNNISSNEGTSTSFYPNESRKYPAR